MTRQDNSFRVQVRVKLVTKGSGDYQRAKRANPDHINQDQPIFPKFDMAMTKGANRVSRQKQQAISEEVDTHLKEMSLWDEVLDGVTPDHIAQMPQRGVETDTKYFDVGTIDGDADDDVKELEYDLSLDALEHYISKVAD